MRPTDTTAPAAEIAAQSANATLKDIKHLVEQLRLRDERMSLFEQDFRRLTEDFRKLREDVLPALRLAKDAQQPLPNIGNGVYEATIPPPMPTPSTSGPSSNNLKRQYSTKKIMLGPVPKPNSSPSHLQTAHDRSIVEQTLDPSSAAERAVLSSSHLAAMNGSGANAISPGYPSPNMPSPTSPPTNMSGGMSSGGTTLASRSYRSEQTTPSSSSRSTFAEAEHYGASTRGGGSSTLEKGGLGSAGGGSRRGGQTPMVPPDTPSASTASADIFKSFRVSMDDPCYKVLPAALKKYQIKAPWDQYALYILYGDQERCLGLDEKPLILFKQLDKEGKKPMFMLRKTNNAQVDLSGDGGPQSAGLGSASLGRGGAQGGGYDPPGGII